MSRRVVRRGIAVVAGVVCVGVAGAHASAPYRFAVPPRVFVYDVDRGGGAHEVWLVAEVRLNRALPSERVLESAVEMARDIAAHVAPMSAALCKRLLWDSAIHNYSPRQVASLETQLHHRVMGTADAREGVTAFLDRRAPRFSSRLSADWAPLPEP